MKRITCLAILAGILVIFAFTCPAAAQDKSVVMPSRTGEITIRPDGMVDVCETWAVQFIGGPFKYARRTIPLNKVESIENWRVSENGQPYQEAKGGAPNTYQVSTENNQQIAIWYFPPTTDQTRTFEVCYTLVGALRIGDAQDEFYWKFIEPDRSYPVEDVQVRLHLPKTFDPNEIEATTYRNGEDAGSAQILDGATVAFTSGRVEPRQEWEIRVRFPHGAVNAQPPAWQTGATSDTSRSTPKMLYSILFWLGLLGIVGLVVLLMVYTRKSGDNKPENAFGKMIKILYGWPLIPLGMVIFAGGPILNSIWDLPGWWNIGAIVIGIFTILAGAIGLGQRSGGGGGGGGRGGGGGGDWGGGGGDFGGGGGGGGSDFG